MSDKDDKKPKPDDVNSDGAAGAPKEGAAKDGPVTDEQEVVEVVVGQTAVPVTAVETDTPKAEEMASDADATGVADDAKPDDGQPGSASDDASVQPPPVAATAPRRADRGARFLAFIAILIALGVGATTILPQVRGGSADRIAQLQSEIDGLTTRNRTLSEKVEAGGTATAAAPVDLSGVEARLAELEASIADVSGLQDRLATLESAATTAGPVATASDAASLADIAALRAQIAAIAAAAPTGATVNVVPQASGEEGGVNDALLAELNGLEERLAAIERNTGEAGIATGDLRDSLEALRDRMAALASEADALSQRVDAVAEAAAGQQSQADAEAAQKAALVLALGRLRDVATTSSAFPGAWNSVVELGVDPGNHAAIADAAQHGIATVDDLRQRFAAVADAALTAERIGGDDTWYGSAFQRLGNLVSVRRVGDVEGTSVEAIVTRAEYRLQEGNLEAALAELDGLNGPPAEAIASWRSTAEARLELERAIRALQQGIFQNMAQEN